MASLAVTYQTLRFQHLRWYDRICGSHLLAHCKAVRDRSVLPQQVYGSLLSTGEETRLASKDTTWRMFGDDSGECHYLLSLYEQSRIISGFLSTSDGPGAGRLLIIIIII